MDRPTEHYDAMIKKLEAIRHAKVQPPAIRAAMALAYLEDGGVVFKAAQIMEGKFDT